MRIANAPCSWGVLEFESTVDAPAPEQMLDEMSATGYAGTELGDWGFLPTDPDALRGDLQARKLSLVGAFVPIALSNPRAHADGEALALRTAQLLRAAAEQAPPPPLVISDATVADAARTARAGRITPADGLPHHAWHIVVAAIERIARTVLERTSVPTVFHHHCATFVETADEIDTVMRLTSPDLVGLCVDTGHALYGGSDPVALVRRHRDRIRHVHFKDCSPEVASEARRAGWDYATAVRRGLFCELGRGAVDFHALIAELQDMAYDGWIVVEQDVLPSTGTPAESAARNRDFLRRAGL